ncbi:MAG: DUF4101 domain-containing protein [Acidobacteria bacterium]|nr:DUF4101 domain-containing protein [Acidobacteriota bacterium]
MLDLPTMARKHLVLVALSLLLLAAGSLIACGPEEVSDADRAAIEQTLRSYLPVLAKAYADGNIEPLREFAAERELARVYSRVSELAEEGKVVEPTFKQMTIEQVVVWNHSNAYVTTLEVWDLRVFPSGSSTVLSEELDQSNRVKYQLQRRGDHWQVLARELEQAVK